jgi:hypothetical protein
MSTKVRNGKLPSLAGFSPEVMRVVWFNGAVAFGSFTLAVHAISQVVSKPRMVSPNNWLTPITSPSIAFLLL